MSCIQHDRAYSIGSMCSRSSGWRICPNLIYEEMNFWSTQHLCVVLCQMWIKWHKRSLIERWRTRQKSVKVWCEQSTLSENLFLWSGDMASWLMTRWWITKSTLTMRPNGRLICSDSSMSCMATRSHSMSHQPRAHWTSVVNHLRHLERSYSLLEAGSRGCKRQSKRMELSEKHRRSSWSN